MEALRMFWTWLTTNMIDLALVAVGTSAFVTYFLQKKTKKKTAATLILDQIDSIEHAVNKLKEGYSHGKKELTDNDVYLSNEVKYTDAWDKYKHLMIKGLSQSERELIQRFFESACQIEKARTDIIFSFKLGWEHKSQTLALMTGKFRDPTFQTDRKKADDLLRAYENNTIVTPLFKPHIAYTALYAELDNYTKLSGTTAYEKLQEMSFRAK